MPDRVNRRPRAPRSVVILANTLLLCGGAIFAVAAKHDQPATDAVGVIEGPDIAVTGPMSVEMVGAQVRTVLRSGSDVRVKSGQARINLVESGQISICGPAHFSVLKAGGALTLALENGVVHMRLDRAPAVTVFTAQIQAQPVAIGDDPRDFLVGFENAGAMCIRTYRGAVRLEQQLTGQNVMVPQGGDILLMNGQIDSLGNGTGRCNCEFEVAKAVPAPATPAPGAISSAPAAVANNGGGSTVAEVRAESAAVVAEKPATKGAPVYQVSLPPLRYDATATVQPEPDARLMLIVRKVRVRPTLIFQGKVEGDPPVAAAAIAPPTPPASAAAPLVEPKSSAVPSQISVMARVWSFFKSLWARGR